MYLHAFARHAALAAALTAAALGGGCTTPAPPAMTSVSGTATYRERIALPPGAVFEALIEDVSRADAPALPIASTRDEAPGAPPVRFTLTYDPARILPSHRYAIRARVLHGAELLFTSDTHLPLPSGPDAAPVSILMVSARGTHPGLPAASGTLSVPGAATAGPALLRGEYRYLADAGSFTDCQSGVRVPVAQALDNAALEAAYLKARAQPGAPLHATLVGRIEERAGMEGPARPTLMVEHFIHIAAGTCASPPAPALEDTYWRLASLGNAPVVLAAEQRAPYVVLASVAHRASGYAGCNRMMGGYELDGAKLAFTQMAGTMMACAQGMELEQRFHAALANVAAWRLTGARLELLDDSGQAVAGFVSP